MKNAMDELAVYGNWQYVSTLRIWKVSGQPDTFMYADLHGR